MTLDPLDQVAAIGEILDSLGIPWVLGGSLASSFVGEPRSTVDIDVAVVMDLDHVEALVSAVERQYYVSADMVRDAVERHSAFNLLHLGSGMKVDVFPLSDELLDARQMAGRQRLVVDGVALWVGSAEDQILRKLRWFRLGGEVSDRQWRDVAAIVRVQGDRLDRQLLGDLGAELGLGDLVERLLAG